MKIKRERGRGGRCRVRCRGRKRGEMERKRDRVRESMLTYIRDIVIGREKEREGDIER